MQLQMKSVDIADTVEEGEVVEEGYDGNGEFKKVKTKDAIQRSKLRVETRLKLLAKWSPEKYGDKKQVDVQQTSRLFRWSLKTTWRINV